MVHTSFELLFSLYIIKAIKLFGQLAILGVQILGRAFVEAYKQAIKKAANTPGTTNTLPSRMSLDEAFKILNVTKDMSREAIAARYEHLFKVNDRKAGGAFYLQSKIVRARETIENELKKTIKPTS